MIIEITIAVLVGVIGGIFSGLTPGIHTNLLVTLLFSISPFLLAFTSPLIISALIVSMAITHTFLNVLPAVYLGAPDSEGKILSVLPGHRMLLQGKGYEAVTLTVDTGGLSKEELKKIAERAIPAIKNIDFTIIKELK